MLLEKGADPNVLDIDNCAPLNIACGTGGTKCIDILMEFGAELNSPNVNGYTPLH